MSTVSRISATVRWKTAPSYNGECRDSSLQGQLPTSPPLYINKSRSGGLIPDQGLHLMMRGPIKGCLSPLISLLPCRGGNPREVQRRYQGSGEPYTFLGAMGVNPFEGAKAIWPRANGLINKTLLCPVSFKVSPGQTLIPVQWA